MAKNILEEAKKQIAEYQSLLEKNAKQLVLEDAKKKIDENVKKLIKEETESDEDEYTDELDNELNESDDHDEDDETEDEDEDTETLTEEDDLEEGNSMVQSHQEKHRTPKRKTIKRQSAADRMNETVDLRGKSDKELMEAFNKMSDDDELIIKETENKKMKKKNITESEDYLEEGEDYLTEEELLEFVDEMEKELEEVDDEDLEGDEIHEEEIPELDLDEEDLEEGEDILDMDSDDSGEDYEDMSTGDYDEVENPTEDEFLSDEMDEDQIVEELMKEMEKTDSYKSIEDKYSEMDDMAEGELTIDQDGDDTVITHEDEMEDEDFEGMKDDEYMMENKRLKSKYNKLVKENSELKKGITDVVKNYKKMRLFTENLVHVNKLISENAVTKTEKVNIIKRFDNVKSLNESKSLYKAINTELNENVNKNTKVKNQVSDDKKLNENKEMLKTKIVDKDNKTKITESKIVNTDAHTSRIKDLMNKVG